MHDENSSWKSIPRVLKRQLLDDSSSLSTFIASCRHTCSRNILISLRYSVSSKLSNTALSSLKNSGILRYRGTKAGSAVKKRQDEKHRAVPQLIRCTDCDHKRIDRRARQANINNHLFINATPTTASGSFNSSALCLRSNTLNFAVFNSRSVRNTD